MFDIFVVWRDRELVAARVSSYVPCQENVKNVPLIPRPYQLQAH